MSSIALFGALESGLIYALVALGVLISFRILDFPDLTADGSFPLGGAVFAICVTHGINPWLATALGGVAGACAGLVTAWLHVSLKIMQLLASILVMVALYSVNLRIMGAPNLPLLDQPSVFTPFFNADGSNQYWVQPLVIFGFVLVAKFFLDWFFATEIGLSMRATGVNARMARAQGVNTSRILLLGMAISNAFIALAGALFVQTQGGADISIGIGTIVVGLAAVIIGETLIPGKRFIIITLAVIVGAVLYRAFIALALGSDTLQHIGFGPQDLNLVTAILVVLALRLPAIKGYFKRKFKA
ncbi:MULTISPECIES: ABC transporter permease [Snodgrassella]|uniref:ABC-type putative transport system, permease component n=1 Tax=Snodgrassella alvi SCGC AB-598-J21 TaxID=1385367 RepID=A0A074VZK8_9NEIS|nr:MULTISPECIES: ABC transporter permease [Snodgrassella]KEQ00664.1 ABC-type putative transport system, permease component [Snodgrassella alvi SCGC AB-598-J21]MBI0158107.1 ABC transporter permease [Snodgrassella sp. W6238H11]MBI0160068.1 ABC transporter permease [Snodgrassella sp. W6238H14]MBI0164924.1 ABC transporter permease [Snodgrassella sp. M0351]MBI0181726.1 ABC transporter permease [Snodgrassella sp. W8158]